MVAALTLKGLTVTIAGQEVLAPLDLELARGKVLGISGESGAGKSMTAFAIMGLLPGGSVRRGQITLDGERIDTLSDQAMGRVRGRRIGMVFQEPMTALNPLRAIGSQIAEVFRQHQRINRVKAARQADAVLARVGLGDIPSSRLPHELSGGQRQRVVIAMAIALKPGLLIADEATTALDATTQLEILGLIQRLAREDGMAVMLITHDLGVIARMADDIIIMQDGKAVERGSVAMLAGGLTHPHAIALAEAASPPAHKADKSRAKTRPAPPLLKVEGLHYDWASETQSTANGLSGGLPLGLPRGLPRGLRGIDLSIGEGETLGLVGASGCGKTTLAKLLLGLYAPDGGSITLDGENLPVPPRGGMVSAVFQDPYSSFNPRHRILRLVTEPFHAVTPAPSGQHQGDAAAAMLERVGIDPGMMERSIHAASGGQRQRIAFARALITTPRLIVLDEPVSALDAPIRVRVLAAMAEIAREAGIATLFISHDLAVVRSVCPRVMVMADGALVEDGPTADVFANPRHPETARLVDAALDWRDEIKTRLMRDETK